LIDRVNEVLSILSRAKAKLQDGSPPETIESPLHTLDFIAKAVKRSNRLSVTGAMKATRKAKRTILQPKVNEVFEVEKPKPAFAAFSFSKFDNLKIW